MARSTRRRIFAAARVVQMTLLVLGILTLTLTLTAPVRRGQNERALYDIAWASRPTFVVTGGLLIASALVIAGVLIPVRKRWARDLRGWID